MTAPLDDLPDDEMAEYLQAYLDETEEELETLTQALLRLEQDPRDAEAVNEAFRMMHSLKGSSGLMGYEGVADLAHHLENRFDSIREGQTDLDRATMEVMLACVDYFRAFLDRLRSGDSNDSDAAKLTDQLLALVETPLPASPATPVTQSPPPGWLTMGGGYRIRVTFQPGLQLADLKAKLILARLANLGEIIGSEPTLEDIQSVDEVPEFVILIATDRDPEEVKAVANVDGVATLEIVNPVAEASRSSAQTAPDFKDRSEPDQQEHVSAAKVEQSDAEIEASDETECVEQTIPPEAPSKVQRATETIRVDINRLDRLMNLTGELVISNARFNQIADELGPSLKRVSGSRGLSDLSERLSEGFQKLRSLHRDSPDDDSWESIFNEIESDLAALQEESAGWESHRRQFSGISEAIDQLARVSKNLQKGVLETRMVPVGPLFSRFRRVIRDLSVQREKEVNLVIHGEQTELDKRMIDELGDPLLHLIRNSIDHGLETSEQRRAAGKPEQGTIFLEASHSGNNVFVTVRDDGAGIDIEAVRRRIVEREMAPNAEAHLLSDQEVIDFIWHPGFSTANQITEISGRGVGMDIVQRRIMELNGSVEVSTEPGRGTTFSLRLPLTLAIVRSLIIRHRTVLLTIPIDDVREIVAVPLEEIHTIHGHQVIDVREEMIPVVSMDEIFDWNDAGYHYRSPTRPLIADRPTQANVVVLQSHGKTLGLRVDELLGGADIVIKSLADNFVNIEGLSGASITGDGTVCLMLDTAVVIGKM